MIVVTGAAGFIGSCLITKLNEENFNYIVAVDDFSNVEKNKNLVGKKIKFRVHRDSFFKWIIKYQREIEFIIHLGARTDTFESDSTIFDQLNFLYSQRVWNTCCQYIIPLIYASSAATYAGGKHGYDDNKENILFLKPLNHYAESKNRFDIWAIKQVDKPFFWVGIKFFNVFGPNEYHKKRMASMIFHAFHQVQQKDKINLFRSHNPSFSNGYQKRDFIYVKDVIKVIMFFLHHRKNSDIYNLGTGRARTFLDLAKTIFKIMKQKENIDFIDIPQEIRENYQYFTQANIEKLRNVGYKDAFYSLEEGIKEYISRYLIDNRYF